MGFQRHANMTSAESGPDVTPKTESGLLAEFDGSVCPACHHREHDPGSCHEGCDRCELHTDEALAFVIRYDPELMDRIRSEAASKAVAENFDNPFSAAELLDIFDRTADKPDIRAKITRILRPALIASERKP